MERITGTTTAISISRIKVNWTMEEDGTVTANGETAGRVIESPPGRLYCTRTPRHNWEARFTTAANAAAALAAWHFP